MYKNEKDLSLKNLRVKDALISTKKVKNSKISKSNLQQFQNSLKEVNKNNSKKYCNQLSNKNKSKNQIHINNNNKITKKIVTKNLYVNPNNISLNFSLYNDKNRLIENYTDKKAYNKRQANDGFQKIKGSNTGHSMSIKFDITDNKTSTNKEIIQNMKLMINKKDEFNFNNYINFSCMEENNKINIPNQNICFSAHKDKPSYENLSKLKINGFNLSYKKENNKKKEEKNLISQKSLVDINKSQNIFIKNSPIFCKKIMSKNKLFNFKTPKNSGNNSEKELMKMNSNNILITNKNIVKINRIDTASNLFRNNIDFILPNSKTDLLPFKIKKYLKNKGHFSHVGLNNGIKENKSYKRIVIRSNNNINSSSSRNYTNRESTNFMTDKNKMNEEEAFIVQNKDIVGNSPELDFFNLVKMIQKTKNSMY